jgi:hypothetical protein
LRSASALLPLSFILNALKLDTAHPKKSVRLRRKRAAWDDDERMRVLGMKLI